VAFNDQDLDEKKKEAYSLVFMMLETAPVDRICAEALVMNFGTVRDAYAKALEVILSLTRALFERFTIVVISLVFKWNRKKFEVVSAGMAENNVAARR